MQSVWCVPAPAHYQLAGTDAVHVSCRADCGARCAHYPCSACAAAPPHVSATQLHPAAPCACSVSAPHHTYAAPAHVSRPCAPCDPPPLTCVNDLVRLAPTDRLKNDRACGYLAAAGHVAVTLPLSCPADATLGHAAKKPWLQNRLDSLLVLQNQVGAAWLAPRWTTACSDQARYAGF
eukprot:CAMPEP_0202897948 /NCGR_PEP_ID=MMETSP1392-20130828/6576_1 /ASSEMBLY_ACC=CAM_ASM_000868 /TAXON_ID=225041 /ORGANISM="Chlamydomonas chlamydogama, Strain SAG 11-48b" /LENGTH=177 /DNA_ID=CAMNT_0049583723 /DNA_START=594 /DNA_END=1128 /DNA_ORIENTATION=-